eukprot:13747143-Alexandrium_andersonii.AAC.1
MSHSQLTGPPRRPRKPGLTTTTVPAALRLRTRGRMRWSGTRPSRSRSQHALVAHIAEAEPRT